VLDLGCGTGWVRDHFAPRTYVGIDPSAGMLDQLHRKHPAVELIKAAAGDDGWDAGLHPGQFDAITSTWAAHEFPLRRVLRDCVPLLRPGGQLLLHGSGPRYLKREHYIAREFDDRVSYLGWREPWISALAPSTLTFTGAYGTGAAPDWMSWKPAWQLWTHAPVNRHWGILATWVKP
jgi:SAM-dependent methyltransferase